MKDKLKEIKESTLIMRPVQDVGLSHVQMSEYHFKWLIEGVELFRKLIDISVDQSEKDIKKVVLDSIDKGYIINEKAIKEVKENL